MSFALVGSVITQTGTDTNLSGLSAVAGVTITNFTTGGFITYSCAYRLIVQGTLTIDPEKETFITSYAPASATEGGIVRVEGTLNVGVDKGPLATKRKSHGIGIYITNATFQQGGEARSARIMITSTGTFNLYSSVRFPDVAEMYAYDEGGTVNIVNGTLYATNIGTGTNFRIRSSLVSVNGFTTNLAQMLLKQPALFKGVNVQGASRAIVFYGTSGGTGLSSLYEVRDYVRYDSTDVDFEFIDQAFANSYNSTAGSNLRVRNWFGLGAPTRSDGYVKAIQECIFTIKNTSGTALNQAKVFVRDIDNGLRQNLNGQNDLADKTYILTSNSSGITGTGNIIIAIWNKGQTGDFVANKDLRFNSNDEVTFNFSDYLSDLFSSTYTLRNAGGLNTEVRLVPDLNITQTNTATVAAYTAIDDLSKFYDYGKYWRVQDANLEYPSVTTKPINANGSTIDLGARNLVVDATAASVFAINTGTNTITIKATTFNKSAKFTKIVTTGTITFINGAAPASDLSYQDSAGLRVAIVVTGLTANSRVQLYNTDTTTEIYNDIVASTSLSRTVIWTTNQTIRYRVMYVSGVSAKKWIEATGTLTSLGLNINITQEDDLIYNSIGIDGSTVSECSITGTSLVININDADNKTTAQRLLAFEIYWLYTEDGMRDQNLYIEYPDSTHLIFLGGLKVKNLKPTTPLSITGASIVPESGDPSDVIDSSGGSININTDRVVAFTDNISSEVWANGKALTVSKFLGLK